jgi:hypothetical protein
MNKSLGTLFIRLALVIYLKPFIEKISVWPVFIGYLTQMIVVLMGQSPKPV